MDFQSTNLTQVGVKGSDVYSASGVSDPRVALSALLVRNTHPTLVHNGMKAILDMKDDQALEDVFVLSFQTRDIRGGKGERDVSEIMFRFLVADPRTKELTLQLMDLLPEYGSWRDLFILCEYQKAPTGNMIPYAYTADVRCRIYDIVVNQIHKDEKAISEGKSASLLAKWIPREDRDWDQAREIAKRLNPTEAHISRLWASYRKRISALNKAIKTVEVPMCAGDWETIEPAHVPGRALKLYTKAFLNEVSSTKKGERLHAGELRHPDDPVRMACREHFQEHFAKATKGEAKVNGSKTVFPHELIKKIVNVSSGVLPANRSLSFEEKNSIIAIWNQMVKDAKESGGLGRSLAMCDFSGSMMSSGSNGDTPYWVSMAMGLLISEVTTEEFKDTFLTFDSRPRLHQLPNGDIFQRVASIGGFLGQGTSTDFQKAMDLVLAQLKAKRCRPGQEPENLIVLTDMNWDQACASNQSGYSTGNSYSHVVKTDPWQTHVEMIREAFKRAGEDMWGEGNGFKMPTIVIWNIASTSADFHAKADTEGVVMLSGWSASLFKVLQTKGVMSWTPYQALRAQLDDQRYNRVRERVRAWLVEHNRDT